MAELHLSKTPNELAAETPDETADRYNVDTSVTKTDAENPRVQWDEDDFMAQVPSGTHLHPDIAKDPQNRGISIPTTDIGQIRKGDTFVGYDFADPAPEPVADSEPEVDEEYEWQGDPTSDEAEYETPVNDGGVQNLADVLKKDEK